jgi:hypothetical protein
MGKRTPRLPVASAGPGDPIVPRSANTGFIRSLARPRVAITDSGWQQIEKAYGQELSPEARGDVYEKTQKYVDRAEFEQNAEPVSDARDQIKAIIKAAKLLRSALYGGDRDADVYAHTLIKKHLWKQSGTEEQKEGDAIEMSRALKFARRRRRKKDALLRNISSDVRRLIFASVDALEELEDKKDKDKKDQGFSKGEAWERWIVQLTSIAEKHGLPWRVRKDSDKQSVRPVSPFVKFVWELQQFVPKTHRLEHSRGAVAEAIVKARRKNRVG